MRPPELSSTQSKYAVAPATAFQVNVGVPVAMLPDGASRVGAPGGVLLSMVNTSALEVPPPGVGENTVTDAVPAGARSAAVPAAVSRVALTNVVVRAAPFQRTLEPLTKLLPFTVSVRAAPPAVALVGDTDVSVGAGLVARPVPVTPRETLPPLAVKVTLVLAIAATTGAKRTVPVAVEPAPTRLNEAPETTLKGADVVTVPDTVPPPVFCTVNV